jgi:hypothetical protein
MVKDDDADWIELHAEPIDVGRAVAFVTTPAGRGDRASFSAARARRAAPTAAGSWRSTTKRIPKWR